MLTKTIIQLCRSRALVVAIGLWAVMWTLGILSVLLFGKASPRSTSSTPTSQLDKFRNEEQHIMSRRLNDYHTQGTSMRRVEKAIWSRQSGRQFLASALTHCMCQSVIVYSATLEYCCNQCSEQIRHNNSCHRLARARAQYRQIAGRFVTGMAATAPEAFVRKEPDLGGFGTMIYWWEIYLVR